MRFVTIHMTNDPYALGTMGPGFPIFRRPAQVAPRITDDKANEMEQTLLCILHHNYGGRDWVDNAMVHLRDDGLQAEVQRYHKLQEELGGKMEEVRILEDRIADIYLELGPCTQQLHRAEAVERVKSQHIMSQHINDAHGKAHVQVDRLNRRSPRGPIKQE